MPIYEYRCEKGHTFEVMQRMADDALTECQVCGGAAQRVFSAPAVHFKGSGFYNTDYGKKTKGATAPGSDSGGGDTSSTTSASDSKPSSDAKSSSSDSSSKGSEKKGEKSTSTSKPSSS